MVLVRGVDDVGLNGEVVADEFGRIFVVGMDATDLGGSEEDVAGLFGGKKGFDRGLVGEVEFGVGAGEEVLIAMCLQVAHKRGTYQAAVTGDVDFRFKMQDSRSKLEDSRCKVQVSRFSGADAFDQGM